MEYKDQNAPQQVPPPNNMALAIVSTIIGICSLNVLCLGLLVGIVSIYYASQVNSRFYMGDYAGAEKASKTAKTMAFISLGLTVLAFVVGLVLVSLNPAIMEQQRELLEQMMNK